jgi:hypothetical protein
LPLPGWEMNPGSFRFLVYFLITRPLSHSGSPSGQDGSSFSRELGTIMYIVSYEPIELRNPSERGDQIGRIFAYWAIDYFGHVFVTNIEAAKILQLLFTTEKFVY